MKHVRSCITAAPAGSSHRMKHTLFTTLLLMPLAALPAAELRDTFADAWPATDALGRTLPLHQEAGGARADRFVGIFYFNWQASFTGPPFNHTRVFDNTKLIAANPNKPAWGPPGIPHYWGEPRFGYYRPDDPWVIRKHAQMLTDAGVDVLIFDASNGPTYDHEREALCVVLEDFLDQGDTAPNARFNYRYITP
jgi:hypothetical protein